MFIKWSRVLHKCYTKHEFSCTMACSSTAKVWKGLEFKLFSDLRLSFRPGWPLLRFASRVQTKPQSSPCSYLAERRLSRTPSMGAAVPAKERLYQLELSCLCWQRSCLARESLCSHSLDSPPGAPPAQPQQPQPGAGKAKPWEQPWEPSGARGSLCTWWVMIFSYVACQATSSFPLCSPAPPSESPVSCTATFLFPFSAQPGEDDIGLNFLKPKKGQDLNLPWSA